MNNRVKVLLFLFLILAIMTAFVFAFVPKLSVGLIELNPESCSPAADAISVAAQMGRLDVITFVLSLVGICVAFFAAFTYFDTKAESVSESKRIAQKLFDEWSAKYDEELDDRILAHLVAMKSQQEGESTPPPIIVRSPGVEAKEGAENEESGKGGKRIERDEETEHGRTR